MHWFSKISFLLLTLLVAGAEPSAVAAPSERRLALVIGNGSYRDKPLSNSPNDAGLIAQTLQAAGFEVMGGRDLDQGSLRSAFSDFVDRAAKAGSETVAMVYFAGYGLQFQGENYLVPIDGILTHDTGVPGQALRLSDYTKTLGGLHLKTIFVILDAARANPFGLSGQPLAGGLAWAEPEPNMLIAFNAAPGTVAPDGRGSYGPYAKGLAEMIREGGLTPSSLFERVRLRVNELTAGAQIPWNASKLETKFYFFERGLGAPPRVDSPEHTAWMRSQPMRTLGAQYAYMVALMRDTFDGYGEFLAEYWSDPTAKRLRAALAVRREALTWWRTFQAGTPQAYWSYLKRYPGGPHAGDAQRLLMQLSVGIEAPPRFAMMEYDVPSPLPGEVEYIERSVPVFDEPEFALATPLPVEFLQAPPPEFSALGPPRVSAAPHLLPVPPIMPLPVYISLPANVLSPPASESIETVASITDSDSAILSTSTVAPSSADDLASSGSPPSAPSPTGLISQSPILKNSTLGEAAPPKPPLPTLSLLRPAGEERRTFGQITTLVSPLVDTEVPQSSVPIELVPPVVGSIPLPRSRSIVAALPKTGFIPLPLSRPVILASHEVGNSPSGDSSSTTDHIPLPLPRPKIVNRSAVILGQAVMGATSSSTHAEPRQAVPARLPAQPGPPKTVAVSPSPLGTKRCSGSHGRWVCN